MDASAARRAIEAVFRIESAGLIAALARMVRDVGLAEDLAQDAMVAALERWPEAGIPDKPAAWLMATAKNRAIDRLRHRDLARRKHEEIGREIDARTEEAGAELAASLDDPVGDDLLRLVFISCHPVLPAAARVALTLRLVGGLTTAEIARAYLVPEPTIAQRLVRAKRTLAEAKVPFEVPRGAELGERLASVLEVIYLIFNEGYAATAGDVWMRPQLCQEALRLGRILAGLAPREPEVHGLVALMEIQASRFAARSGTRGEPVLLLDQNRARWDPLLIRRGVAALDRAGQLAATPGPYALQAAIAACHARARTAAETDWPRIAALYGALAAITPSPVIELNRAVAVGLAQGPIAGLAVADALLGAPALADYYLLPAVRADLLVKLARFTEARAELERAAGLTRNESERRLLLARLAALPREGRGEGDGAMLQPADRRPGEEPRPAPCEAEEDAVSVQWIACPDCAFRLPYAILGKQGSFRTGREFATLCRHRPDSASMNGLDCPALRAEAERVLKIRLPGGDGAPRE